MIPVDQQVLHDPDNGHYGDCMRACIASLLELSPDKVPHFYQSGDANVYRDKLRSYLYNQGFRLVTVNYDKVTKDLTDSYCIIHGHTVRGTFHGVIGKGVKIVHDPHPTRTRLLGGNRNWKFSFLKNIC